MIKRVLRRWVPGDDAGDASNELRFSVILPVLNGEKTLPATLDSLRAQSHPHWELVAVDDGSGDRTREILDRFADTVTQPVTVVPHPVNRGLSAARNSGAARARAGWLALLDADDLWNPRHLADAAALLARSECDCAFSSVEVLGQCAVHPRTVPEEAFHDLPAALFRHAFIYPSAALVRREAWLAVGGMDPRFRFCGDFELWLRGARAGWRFAFIDDASVRYRVEGERLSHQRAAMARDRHRALLRHRDWEALSAAARRRSLVRSLKSLAYCLRVSRPDRAARLYGVAFRLAPWQLHHALFAVAARAGIFTRCRGLTPGIRD